MTLTEHDAIASRLHNIVSYTAEHRKNSRKMLVTHVSDTGLMSIAVESIARFLWSTWTWCFEYIKLNVGFFNSLPNKVFITSRSVFITWSLFSLFVALGPRLWSPSPESRPPTSSSYKITNRFFQYASPLCTFGINFLNLSVSLMHIFHLVTSRVSDYHCYYHHSHHPFPIPPFTLDLKLASSSSHFHHRIFRR